MQSRATKKNLVIIESPTKARALANSIDDKKSFKIISCYGRLLELDPISPDRYLNSEEVKWSAVNPKNLSYIEQSAKEADSIYIATDPDIEGEVIAWQLAELFDHIGIPGGKVARITIESFTQKGITESLKKPVDLFHEKAQSGITRRIFDNFSQFSMPTDAIKKRPYIKGSSSRIAAPTLKSISEDPLETYTIKYQRDGMPLPAYIQVNADQDYQKVKRQLDRLPNPVMSKIERTEKSYKQEGLDFQSLLLKSKEVTGLPQEEIYDSLQSLYVKGKISYFRSDCKDLSSDHQKHIKKELRGQGGDKIRFPKDKHSSEENRVQEGHTAIAPLVPIGKSLGSLHSLSPEDKLLAVIWRHWVLNSQERTLHTTKGHLEENAFENSHWKKLEKEFNIRFEKKEISTKFGKQADFDPILKPLGVARDLFETEGAIKSIRHSKEEALLRRLISLELGRPSTLVYHSKKIGDNFISSNNCLNSRGLSAIIENQKNGNLMVDIHVARSIEKELHTLHKDGDSESILRSSLSKSGYDFSGDDKQQKQAKKRTHRISWGGIEI